MRTKQSGHSALRHAISLGYAEGLELMINAGISVQIARQELHRSAPSQTLRLVLNRHERLQCIEAIAYRYEQLARTRWHATEANGRVLGDEPPTRALDTGGASDWLIVPHRFVAVVESFLPMN